ncbi:uncharacterized protein LOC128547664 [Mercenaria mercenaria]|uniref:uncharacterized protein LOC128547664 n=1 Tax=Mercenaria mercenaria TaxID=6596 RepID=UPI00234FA865|nr:uncharacterized protein LOC128547664 [Mercenaria mercenaria]
MNAFAIILFFELVAIAGCQLVGTPEDVDVNDKDIQRLAKVTAKTIGKEYELWKLISGTEQVVNGRLYSLELVMQRKIKGSKNIKRRCNVIVYEIKSEGYLEIEEFHCYFANKEPVS